MTFTYTPGPPATPLLVGNLGGHEERIFRELCAASPDQKHLWREPLAAELFALLYKADPQFTPVTVPGHELEHETVRRLWASGHFKLLREQTSIPHDNAAVMAFLVTPELYSEVQEGARIIAEWQQEGIDFGGLPALFERGVGGLAELLGNLQQAMSEMLGEPEEADEGGGGRPGEAEEHPPSRTQIQAAFRLIQALSDQKTLQLLDWLGRMAPIHRRSVEEHWSRRPVRPTKVTRSRDLRRQTPVQMGKYARGGASRRLWKRDFADGQLQTYKLEDREVEGRGPIVACVDKSGSMRGTKDAWATALTTMLTRQARQEERDFWNLPFHDYVLGRGQRARTGGGKVLQSGAAHVWVDSPAGWEPYFFPKGKLDPEAFLECYAQTPTGGTNGTNAVQVAWEILDRYPDAKQADVLMITDGYCGMSGNARAIRSGFQQRNARLWVVLMDGGDLNEARAVTEEERVIQIADLRNPQRLKAVLDKVASITV